MPDDLVDDLANAGQVGLTPTVEKPEGIEWLPSGDVRMTWDGVTYTLHAPKLPGIIWLSEKMSEMDKELQVAREAPEVDASVEQVKVVTKGMRAVFAEFSSDKLPKSDAALPAWFANIQMFGWISNHFRTVPLASGTSGPMPTSAL